ALPIYAAAATHRPAGAAAVPAHARAVRVRICQPAFRRLARPGPGRLLAPGVRGDRQATLCHRGLRRVAAVAAAGPDLHPRLDAAAGAPLGPPAPAGVRDRGAGGAALLVDREVRLSRTAAVRGDPRAAARLADGQAAGATADLSPARTAAARPGPRRCRARPTAARGAVSPGAAAGRRHRRWTRARRRARPLRQRAAVAAALPPRSGGGRRTRPGRPATAARRAPGHR